MTIGIDHDGFWQHASRHTARFWRMRSVYMDITRKHLDVGRTSRYTGNAHFVTVGILVAIQYGMYSQKNTGNSFTIMGVTR